MLDDLSRVLVSLATQPPPGWVGAVARAQDPSYGDVEIEANQRTTDWMSREDSFRFAWDAARRLNWAGDEARPMPASTYWSVPVEFPVRLLMPRLLPIWGRANTADRYWPANPRAADHLIHLDLKSAELPTGRALIDPQDQVVLELDCLDATWQIVPETLRRLPQPRMSMPSPSDVGLTVLPS